MKALLFLLFISTTFLITAQYRYFSNDAKKSYLYGVAEQINDSTQKMIIPARYHKDEFKGGYFLYASANDKKGEYTDCIFLDSGLNENKRFKSSKKIGDYHIIVNKGLDLYSPLTNSFVFENCIKIEPVPFQNNLIYYQKDGKTTVVNSNLEEIFTLDEITDFKGFEVVNKFEVPTTAPFLLTGKTVFDIYNLQGRLLLKNVVSMESKFRFASGEEYFYTNYGELTKRTTYSNYWEFKTEDDSYFLLNHDRIILSNLKGNGFKEIKHSNRIVFEQANGFVVYDSLQQLWTEQIFTEILDEYISDWENPVFPVKQGQEWFFTDSLYKAKNNEKFYSIELNEGGGYTVLKSKETAKQIYLYNSYGTPIIEEWVDKVEVFRETYELAFSAIKEGKKALFLNEEIKTPFRFDAISEINDEAFFFKAWINGEVVLIYIFTGETFFEGEGLTNIDGLYDGDLFYDYSNYFFAYKGSNFSIIDFGREGDTLLTATFWGDFELEEIDYPYDSYDNRLFLKKSGKWGAIDLHKQTDRIYMPFEFDEIFLDSDESYELMDNYQAILVKKENQFGLFTFNRVESKFLIEPKYDKISLDGYELIVTQKNKLYGAYDNYLVEICPPVLLKAPTENFVYEGNNEIMSCKVNGEMGKCIMTYSGIRVFDDLVNPALDDYDLFFYFEGEKMGLLNYSLDTILVAEYSSIEWHPNMDWLITIKDGKYGIVSFFKEEILANEYDEIKHPQNEAYELLRKGDKWGVFSEGKFILPLEFEEIQFDSDYFCAKKGGLWGVYDYNGKMLVEHKYKSDKLAFEEAYNNF